MSPVVVFLFCSAFLYSKACEPPHTRVIGGLSAPPNFFPFAAAILHRQTQKPEKMQFCSGSIIAPRWILSAAHCFKFRSENEVVVLVGTTDLRSDEGTRHSVRKIYMHPKYGELATMHQNDIALLLLVVPVEYSRAVLPIMLGSLPPKEGLPIVAMGWGNTSSSGRGTSCLRYVVLKSMGLEECHRRGQLLGYLVNEEILICGWGGGWSGEGKTLCAGDSGGPLIDYQAGTQVGVVSAGKACSARFPTLFTSVETHWPWIKNVTYSLKKEKKPKTF